MSFVMSFVMSPHRLDQSRFPHHVLRILIACMIVAAIAGCSSSRKLEQQPLPPEFRDGKPLDLTEFTTLFNEKAAP